MDPGTHSLAEEAEQWSSRLWSNEGAEALAWLRQRGLGDEVIQEAKLGAQPSGVNIPYLNPDGSVRMNRVRYLHPVSHKYHTPRGGGQHIYNVAATREPRVWLTEGEFDSLILRQMGFPSLALPGANAFRSEWRYLFTYVDLVSIVADGDVAGGKAASRLASILGPVTDVRVIHMPDDFDVNDLYLKDPDMLKGLVV